MRTRVAVRNIFDNGGLTRFWNVGILSTGTVAGQGIYILATPLLSRIYSPATFGTLGAFISLVRLLTSVCTGQYHTAVPLPKKDADAVNLVALSWLTTAAFSMAAVLLLLPTSSLVAAILRTPALADCLWLAPVALLGFGTVSALTGWANRRKYYWRIATNSLFRPLATTLAQLSGYFVFAPNLAMIGGRAFGDVVGAATMGTGVLRRDHRAFTQSFSWADIRRVAREYSDFPRFGATQALLSTLATDLPNLVLAGFFGDAALGFYVLAFRLAVLPTAIIGEALRLVLTQSLSDARNHSRPLAPIVFRSTRLLILLCAVPAVLLLLSAPWAFELVLGPQWITSGRCAQWLAPWTAVALCNAPTVALLRVIRRQRFLLGYNMALIVARVLALSAGAFFGGLVAAVAFFAVSGIAFDTTLILTGLRSARQDDRTQNPALLS